MCYKNILFLLFLSLLSYIKPLQGQDISLSTTTLNQSPMLKLQALETILIKQSVKLDNSERLLTLWQGQYTTLETQHKDLITKSEELQQTTLQQDELLKNLKQTIKDKDSAHNEDISHYKWSRAEFTAGALIVGIIIGFLIAK